MLFVKVLIAFEPTVILSRFYGSGLYDRPDEASLTDIRGIEIREASSIGNREPLQ